MYNRPNIDFTTRLRMNVVEDFLSGTDKTARKAENDKYIAALMKRVNRINELEAIVEELADEELIGKSNEFRNRLKSGEDINGPILEEAFAVVREAAWYVISLNRSHPLFKTIIIKVTYDHGSLCQLLKGEFWNCVIMMFNYLEVSFYTMVVLQRWLQEKERPSLQHYHVISTLSQEDRRLLSR